MHHAGRYFTVCLGELRVLFPSDLPEEERRQSVQATLVQRAGHPENVARAVLFAIDNNFVTGASLVIDGGRTIYAGGM